MADGMEELLRRTLHSTCPIFPRFEHVKNGNTRKGWQYPFQTRSSFKKIAQPKKHGSLDLLFLASLSHDLLI
jgi:hypothetical protein